MIGRIDKEDPYDLHWAKPQPLVARRDCVGVLERLASDGSVVTPLTDEDRWPWLEKMNAEMRVREERGESLVLACSALKEAYRARLMHGLAAARLVYLEGGFELIRGRAQARRNHFMPAALLRSQFDTLEPPEGALRIDAGLAVHVAVAQILLALAP